MARYGSLSVFLTGRSRVTITWVNSLKSPNMAWRPKLMNFERSSPERRPAIRSELRLRAKRSKAC